MIYKYPLTLSDSQELVLPKKAEILSVQFQDEQLCLWAMVDLRADAEVRIFRIYGTGSDHIAPKLLRYIATVQDGSFVWHVFEEIL